MKYNVTIQLPNGGVRSRVFDAPDALTAAFQGGRRLGVIVGELDNDDALSQMAHDTANNTVVLSVEAVK